MEFHIPKEQIFPAEEQVFPPAEYLPAPEALNMPTEEFIPQESSDVPAAVSAEPAAAAPSPEQNERSRRHDMIKRAVLVPVAASVTAVSMIFASFGLDPLGEDVLNAVSTWGRYDPSGIEEPDYPVDGSTMVAAHVTFLPTGENYATEPTYDSWQAYEMAQEWVYRKTEEYAQTHDLSLWQDSPGMVLVRSETVLTGYLYFEGHYEPIKTYRRDNYYEVSLPSDTSFSEHGKDGPEDDPFWGNNASSTAFPKLGNLERDGYVGYAVSLGEELNRQLHENYILLEDGSDAVWILRNDPDTGIETVNNAVPGVTYDQASNTLTLEDYEGPVLNVNMMGNGFRIRLIGENRLDGIVTWGFYSGGSVLLTGDGALTVNAGQQNPYGIRMEAEYSQTCLMIDRDVRLEVFGSSAAVMIRQALQFDSGLIYCLNPNWVYGGYPAVGRLNENGDFVRNAPAEYISEYDQSYCDSTLLIEDVPATHILCALGDTIEP